MSSYLNVHLFDKEGEHLGTRSLFKRQGEVVTVKDRSRLINECFEDGEYPTLAQVSLEWSTDNGEEL